MYYIGDRNVVSRKRKLRWTGPWVIQQKLNDRTAIIIDKTDGISKHVSIDRLKLFHSKDYEKIDQFEKHYDQTMKNRITNNNDNDNANANNQMQSQSITQLWMNPMAKRFLS